MRQIFAAEISFQDTPLIIREKFADTEKNIKAILQVLKRKVDEVFVFCNRQRVTVYIVNDNLKPLTWFFHDEHPLKGYVQFYYNTGEAVTHLMATSSGLLSTVKGESVVISELSRCYQLAVSSGCIGMTLDHAIRRALDTGKMVRTDTGIDKFCSSVVETGIELLYNRVQDIYRINFVIVGTGKLARVALDSLTRDGIRNIAVTGHDPEAVKRMAEKYAVRSIDIKLLPDYFSEADVVIGAADVELEKQLLPALDNEGLMDKGGRVILDLGVPPNFDPEMIGRFADEFYNLDDLRRLQASPLECFGGIEAAWRLVLKASNEFAFLFQLLDRSPVLAAYLNRQFALKNAAPKVRARKGIRSMLSFMKSDNVLGAEAVHSKVNLHTQLNNHVADNAADVVRSVQTVKQFTYFLSDN